MKNNKSSNQFQEAQLIVKASHISRIGDADMICSMEGFTFASALDLIMGYYHIKLDADAQKLCAIVLQW
jgi:hypothetical protein